jgi:hypothetical protein
MENALPNTGLSPEEKLANVQRWFDEQVTVAAEDYRGNTTVGKIDARPESGSGVWGYEGDAINVRINGANWPSSRVRPEQAKEPV